MILVIDNYDSFTYNLVHYLNELGAETRVVRNDDLTVEEALALKPDAVLLSPVFRTRSHPEAATLGPLRFRLLAQRARMPVIALGGMNADTAQRLDWPRWAAIDGLS